jgi:hypothetical protein
MKIKVSKAKNYYQVKVLTDLPFLPMGSTNYMWSYDRKSAETFILAIYTFRNEFSKLIDNKGYQFNPDMVLLRYLPLIDSYSSGIDIRSKLKPEELADNIVSHYNEKYTEAYEFCSETLKFVEENKDDEEISYMKDWKRYDKHNSLIREFYLDFKNITSDDFKGDELKKMSILTGDILTMLKQMNE